MFEETIVNISATIAYGFIALLLCLALAGTALRREK
jgi:hypothetical protein